jgi:hypothetical protein
MAFLIGGHPRSGTTLLYRLCRNHPRIGIAGEFKCFQQLDVPFPEYWGAIETDWRHFSFFWRIGRRAPWYFKAGSGLFLALYRRQLRRLTRGTVSADDVERALQAVFRRSVVGDKYPHYVFLLPKLVRQPRLKRIILYRDALDVVSSFLNMLRTKWKGLPWTAEFRTAGDVARQWVKAVEMMETHREHLLAVRYEDLVREPRRELRKVADLLGVDAAKFDTRKVHTASIGKSRRHLTDGETEEILRIAGPAMERWGYR